MNNFDLDNNYSYRYYKINFTGGQGTQKVLLYEIELYNNTPAPTLQSISVNPATTSIGEGQTAQLNCQALFSDSTTQDVTNSAAWSSSNETVATVQNGVVNALSAGTATTTASYEGYSDTSTINITPPPSVNRALLVITMVNGLEKEYDLSMSDVNAFTDWYDTRTSGSGKAYYTISKSFNKGPFISRKDHIVFDKIMTFEVMEYAE